MSKKMEEGKPENTLLLVNEDRDFLEWATKHLAAEGLQILRTDDAAKALKIFEKASVGVVIADVTLQPFDGLELLSRLRRQYPKVVVILMGGFPTTPQIIDATRMGAFDVLGKESMTFELRSVVEAALQRVEQRKKSDFIDVILPAEEGRIRMIGQSRPMQDVFKLVGRVAKSEAPILILGESGTGKELVARALYEYSPRRQKEMMAINCGAIPENLLESELFGHEKGSFTGAIARRSGRFEDCDGGTLFLDEIGEMPLGVQVKLLRVLQEGTFSRVGSNETLTSDVRIIAATNKDLAVEVVAGRFREDLYYRLNVVEMTLPPLREREGDIQVLAEYFLQRLSRKYGLAQMRISGEGIEFLEKHNWPGNVRELENTMARACALATGEVLFPNDIPLARNPHASDAGVKKAFDMLLSIAPNHGTDLLDWVQRELARRSLGLSKGDIKKAAGRLGTTVVNLRKVLEGKVP